jgi:hypothetical protein
MNDEQVRYVRVTIARATMPQHNLRFRQSGVVRTYQYHTAQRIMDRPCVVHTGFDRSGVWTWGIVFFGAMLQRVFGIEYDRALAKGNLRSWTAR